MRSIVKYHLCIQQTQKQIYEKDDRAFIGSWFSDGVCVHIIHLPHLFKGSGEKYFKGSPDLTSPTIDMKPHATITLWLFLCLFGFTSVHSAINVIPEGGRNTKYYFAILIMVYAVVYPKPLEKIAWRLVGVHHIMYGEV